MPTSAAEPLLAVRALESGYGKIRVLHGIDLTIAAGTPAEIRVHKEVVSAYLGA